MQHDPTSRASRNLIIRLAQTLKGNTALFDDVFVDPLHPQLLNRKAFDRIVDDCDLRGLVWSVTYADADGLKNLNDTHGHEVGDEFLRVIVDTWSLATRAWDRADSLMFRLGGDEFAVLWFQDDAVGPKRLQDAWDMRLACYEDQGVTQSWVQLDGSDDLRFALEEAEVDVRMAKAGRARNEVEALRARVAELEAQQDRLHLDLREAEEGRERLRARLSEALTDVEAVKSDLRESEAARDRLRARFIEAEAVVAAQADTLEELRSK